MSTIKIEKINISNNVARARNQVKLSIRGNALTGNLLEEPNELPGHTVFICNDGLIFTCPDNSQYLSLI